MTILWCGGEDVDFPYRADAPSTNVSYFRTAYSRCAIGFGNKAAISNTFQDITNCWFSFQMFRSGWNSSNYRCVGLSKNGNNSWIGIGSGSANNKIAVLKYDGTTTTRLAEESGTTLSSTAFYKIDINIIDYGSNGTINVYIDGYLKVSYTGDLTTLSNTSLNQVEFQNSNTSSSYGYASEIIVADEDTRLMSLVTYYPNATGDTDDWDGAYTDIDEVTLSDADTIYTTVADEDFQCNLTATPSGNFACKAVKLSYRAAIGASGLAIQSGLKTNSTLSLSATKTLEAAWQTKEDLYQVNPVTSNNFTIAELDAMQIAFRSKTA